MSIGRVYRGQKVSPSFHPFLRKSGRLAPILTPKKQCKPGQKPPNFSKCAKPYQTEKARKDTSFRAFWKTFWGKSALGELGSAAGSLEAVFQSSER